MSTVPSLSIVFPTHNEEALLGRTLSEALLRKMEYPAPVEIIVACNGCTDHSVDIARSYPVKVIDDARYGMSFGNNLGGREALNELLLFWNVDTSLEAGALTDLASFVQVEREIVGGFYTRPDKVYLKSRVFFWVMNIFCRYKHVPAAGAVLISNSVYKRVGGFDESLPQGTGSDLARRALAAGAEFIYVPTKACRTSVRRFEKRGYLRQMLEWRRNILYHSTGRQSELTKHDYEVIR
ncbi:MAG: glycosyltransferase [Planctomycetes bacterium]|nr:glycosyltransferase [Planctomycetota bacterium]